MAILTGLQEGGEITVNGATYFTSIGGAGTGNFKPFLAIQAQG